MMICRIGGLRSVSVPAVLQDGSDEEESACKESKYPNIRTRPYKLITRGSVACPSRT